MGDIGADIEILEEEIELIQEEQEEEEEENENDDDSEDDNEDEMDLKQKKKELKTKKKKLKLKYKKIELAVEKYKKQIASIEARRGGIMSQSDILQEAFSVATNIEDSCLQIIKSQAVTRQSILLSRELLKYKPAIPKAEAKPLWDTIEKGIGDIFQNALELSKISTKYFGFFMKFKQSFLHFVTANKIKKNVSLMVAAEHLVNDVKDIQQFQAKIDGQVDKLRDSAIKTIRDCVQNTAGAQEFETAMNKRKEANQEQWTSKQRIFEYQMQEEQKNTALNQQWIVQLAAQLKNLESLMVA